MTNVEFIKMKKGWVKLKLSFVIPCYCSEQTIERVIDEIDEVMSQRKEFEYEIIAVNDCSPDNVLEVLKSLVEKHREFTVLDLAKNMGKHAAMMAGFSVVRGDYVVNLDDDGQCPVQNVWKLYDALGEKNDIAMAKYPIKKQSGFKNFGSAVNSAMSRILLGKPKKLQFSNFSIMKRYVIKEIINYKNPYPYMEGLILRSTGKIVNVEMEERERVSGKGHYTFLRSLKLWLNGFTAFSVKPLRIATILGFIIAVIGFVFGMMVIIQRILHPELPAGYTSIMAVLLLIGGIIMIMLGLIGEYIGRIYICINNSPQYVIREVIGGKEDERLYS